MYKYKRILIGLDLTEMDGVLLKYSRELVKRLSAEKIYFLHIAENFDIPKDIKEKYPDLLAPKDESIEAICKEQIDEFWQHIDDLETAIEVREGNAFNTLLKFSDQKDIDLVIMGRKKSLKGSGVLPQKVINLMHSSVLLVPEDITFKLDKIVAPIDFSKHSELTVEQVINLSENSETSIQFIHVYTVPSGYHKAGKSYDEFAEIMKNHARADYKAFLTKMDIQESHSCDYVLDDDHRPADKIFNYAEKENADLIVMGSKGRTGLASILLGSVAAKVVSYDTQIPLLVVKEKKENMGFLKALLNI